MAQMKEQIKTQKKEWNKKEANNLADSQSKTLIVRMLKELSKDLSSIKKKIQSETKDTLVEIKNFQGNNSRVDQLRNQLPVLWGLPCT